MPRRSTGCVARALTVALLAIRPALGAELPTARLAYIVHDVEGCPDEAQLRQRTAARLGYDPFAAGSRRTVMATISRATSGLTGFVELMDGGQTAGTRTLSSASGDCDELITAMALAISIAIDPSSALRPAGRPPETSPATESAPPQDAHPAVAARAPEPARRAWGGHLAVGGFASAGTLPEVSGGFMLRAGLRWRRFSVSLEGRTDLPISATSARLPDGSGAETLLVLGLVVPCIHFPVPRAVGRFELSACLSGGGGTIRATGTNVATPIEQWGAYVPLGGRLGAALRLGGPLWAELHVGGLVPLIATTVRVYGADLWRSEIMAGDVGLVVGTHFGDAKRARPQ